ncbi:hypothetical protein C2G38_2203714 [Gigaspora rosea]|uniref:Uncharacterized protein n=1 Tax=Gigaspora rosea TaxID=44941 RepID=A0A397URB1_9GLOM|nr:hypothetical protein C2G38_2203714 [Gigaspora rosea]
MKKRADSDYVAFEFCIKKISAVGIDNEILYEIYKFLFPVQKMIVNEFHAFEGRVKKGKVSPGLTNFQQMFDEAGFEIYMNQRARDAYWKVEEKGNSEQNNAFIRELKVHMDSVLNNQMLA